MGQKIGERAHLIEADTEHALLLRRCHLLLCRYLWLLCVLRTGTQGNEDENPKRQLTLLCRLHQRLTSSRLSLLAQASATSLVTLATQSAHCRVHLERRTSQ